MYRGKVPLFWRVTQHPGFAASARYTETADVMCGLLAMTVAKKYEARSGASSQERTYSVQQMDTPSNNLQYYVQRAEEVSKRGMERKGRHSRYNPFS